MLSLVFLVAEWLEDALLWPYRAGMCLLFYLVVFCFPLSNVRKFSSRSFVGDLEGITDLLEELSCLLAWFGENEHGDDLMVLAKKSRSSCMELSNINLLLTAKDPFATLDLLADTCVNLQEIRYNDLDFVASQYNARGASLAMLLAKHSSSMAKCGTRLSLAVEEAVSVVGSASIASGKSI